MINFDLIARMIVISFRKIMRSKAEQVTNLLEFIILIPFIIFFVKTSIFDSSFFLKGTIMLLFFSTITAASSLGLSSILKRKEGFFREILSSPSSNMSIFLSLILGNMVLLLFRNLVILIIVQIFGLGLSIFNATAILALSLIISPLVFFIALILSSVIENIRLLTILMTIFTIAQFMLSGILIPFKDFFWVAVNPFAYAADLLIYAAGLETNFPVVADLMITIILTIATYIFASSLFSKVEV